MFIFVIYIISSTILFDVGTMEEMNFNKQFTLVPSEMIERYPVIDKIIAESIKQNVNPRFSVGLALVESRFHNSAISNRGARGIFQIMPSTRKWIRKSINSECSNHYLYSVDVNIICGVSYIAYLKEYFNIDEITPYNFHIIAGAYNAGPNGIRKRLENGRSFPKETRNHISKIRKFFISGNYQ